MFKIREKKVRYFLTIGVISSTFSFLLLSPANSMKNDDDKEKTSQVPPSPQVQPSYQIQQSSQAQPSSQVQLFPQVPPSASSIIPEDDSTFPKVGPLASVLQEIEEGYDSDAEYQRHQYTSNRFFRRFTKKPELRRMVENFYQQIDSNVQLDPIKLDGLSSRTRVLLFRELTSCAKVQQLDIPFIFHEKNFKLQLRPSLRQPGYGIIDSIGKYKDVYDVLHIYTPEYQKVISGKLINARQARPYHQKIPYPILSKEDQSIDLEILNILLDFEVARRLQGTADEEKVAMQRLKVSKEYTEFFLKIFDSNNSKNEEMARTNGAEDWKIRFMKSDKKFLDDVPVASAIVGILNLSTKEESPKLLEIFFHAPDNDNYEYKAGDFNVFEGRPDGGRREKAAKEIIKTLRGGDAAHNSTKEDIHQEYLEFFGGASESEGENYNSGESNN